MALPTSSGFLDLSGAVYVLCHAVIVGASMRELTDGLDGLAIVPVMIVCVCLD